MLGTPQRLEAEGLGGARDEARVYLVRGKRDGHADIHRLAPSMFVD
jgi:hypothetical protein